MASHTAIAHRWAQDNGASLKGFNVFCYDGTIYSYGHHFPIASFVNTVARRGKPSRRVILFNSESRSVSTSKHQTYVRRAIPAGVPVIEVPGLRDRTDYTFAANAKPIIEGFESAAAALYAKAARARVNGPWLVRQAESALDDAAAFCDAFGHRWKRPALDAIAERARARAETQRREAEARAREQARLSAIRLAEQREHDAEAFGLWMRGATQVRCPGSYWADPDGNAYVRRYREPDTDTGRDELQTSQGATVPWDHAVKAFRFVALVRARGKAWQRNGQTVRVGHYTLDRIDETGDMTAGCHRFSWANMAALAEREGVLDLAPSDEAVTVSH